MTDLRLTGDVGPWIGGGLALLAAAAVWWWYRREVRRQPGLLVRRMAPALRAATAFLLVLMLTGPVLHHARTIHERGKVLLFVDGSASMQLTDPQLPLARKLLIARGLGLAGRDSTVRRGQRCRGPRGGAGRSGQPPGEDRAFSASRRRLAKALHEEQ